MPKSKRTKAAMTWFETGLAPAKRADEVVSAMVMLAHDIPLQARIDETGKQRFGADVEMSMVLHAEEACAIDLLVHLRDNGRHKGTAKHAKKVLYRAKQRGFDVPEDEPQAKAVRLARKPEPLPSFCSSFDRDGSHVVVLGGWREDDGPWALVGVINDRRGLDTIAWLPKLSRSRFKAVLDDLAERRGGELAEVDPGFAAGRLCWALEAAEAAGSRVEGDRARARRLLEGAEPLGAYGAHVDGVGEAALANGATLVDDACIEGWLSCLDPLLDQAEAKLRERVAQGALEVAEDPVLAALNAEVHERFDDDLRSAFAGRLEISAMLLDRLGRGEPAASAATTARALVGVVGPVTDLPFIAAAIARQAPLDDLLAALRQVAPSDAAEAQTSDAAPFEETSEAAATDEAAEAASSDEPAEAAAPDEAASVAEAADAAAVEAPVASAEAAEAAPSDEVTASDEDKAEA